MAFFPLLYCTMCFTHAHTRALTYFETTIYSINRSYGHMHVSVYVCIDGSEHVRSYVRSFVLFCSVHLVSHIYHIVFIAFTLNALLMNETLIN